MIDKITEIMSGIKKLELQQHHLRNALETMNRSINAKKNLTSEKIIQISDTKPAESARAWVGLMDEEIFGIFGTYVGDADYNHKQLLLDARRIEQALKDKNA